MVILCVVFVVERIRAAALLKNHLYVEGQRDSFFQFLDVLTSVSKEKTTAAKTNAGIKIQLLIGVVMTLP